MKPWISLPFLPLDSLPDVVVEIERLGFEGVTVSDHVCIPAEVSSTYPYTGKQAVLPIETEFPDPLTLIANLAGRTTNLRFMTHVLLVALRHPVVLAKEIATVSALSRGRVDIGVGAGWLREEFDAVGVPFLDRGRVVDETIEAMHLLWTGEPVSYSGRFHRFESISSRPVPWGAVALFGGGYSAAAMQRSSRLQGWLGVTPTVEELAALVSAVRARREPSSASEPYLIRSGVKGTLTPQRIREVAALGIDGLIVTPQQLVRDLSPSPDLPDQLLRAMAALLDVWSEADRARS